MAEEKSVRLGQASRKLNVGHNTILEFLSKKGISVENNPNAKLTAEQFAMLAKEYASSASEKLEASGITIGTKPVENIAQKSEPDTHRKKADDEENVLIKNLGSKDIVKHKDEPKPEKVEAEKPKLEGIKVLGKINLEKEPKKKPQENAVPKVEAEEEKTVAVPEVEAKVEVEKPVEQELIKAKADKLQGLKVLSKIELPAEKKTQPVASSDLNKANQQKRPRKRLPTPNEQRGQQGTGTGPRPNQGQGQKPFVRTPKAEPTDKEIQDQVRATLAKLSGGQKKFSGAKYRKEKRQTVSDAEDERLRQEQESSKTLKVTEFISANDLASLMNVSVNDVISTCLGLGMFVSINQRLDAEAITVIADEFGFEVQFASTEEEEAANEEPEAEEDLKPRAPIVTIMGHVDHGKTSLLDFIRNTKVTASEAGGITQHIGAYDVMTKSGNKIAFLDTPGHEAFTAMRARGAKLTDIAVIVVAADDDVMPQTKEAINHAQVAGVPLVFAINKIDKQTANPEKIKESLSKINILVEDWGGKYQSQGISAKTGIGIEDLLEKVLLEAELLNLKANPDKPAVGSIIEAELDKGRGYVTTLMVQSGTLRVGDVMVAGSNYGRVKAMFDDTGKKVQEAGPSTPVQILGLDGAPQAGEKFQIMETDREAREVANKRSQILREQSIRTKKHITLDEIGRRLAIGSFKQLNVIIKGDVDGSIEALSDSLLKLSTPKVEVSIIHKAVGQISESDVLLASASDAIILGFQVRPSASAKRLADNEEIEIRMYSIIYDAINEIKAAMEGMLEKEFEEVIVGNAEVREVFKITKVGTVAGCMVTDGYIKRNNPIRLIRDGIVVYSGEMTALKRFKDDASEVKSGFDCGMSIKNLNDINIGDVIESYEKREVKKAKA
ncbi:MAG: translation initiation factor IF-2 [Cytophagales bacterium]|jgi:translation initiation factor IF-2|nr:translation initiation factor IF-2 [Cytophagales bacterium]MCA6388459.1 translation initiation factor IF-2 [Cytophagales bacterium]MCA6392596.1 translation initiation factor IF-2 [Cytophagales bacterium]MCA6394324.1 translation initiation factor IF-2 [Cytophagales bacterium]MCA6400315.1 translation initiation factor IF-2 [Cytophagales bacterium]